MLLAAIGFVVGALDASASSVTPQVDRQTYVSDHPGGADPYGTGDSDTSIHVAVANQAMAAHALVHLSLTGIPSGARVDALPLKLIPNGNAAQNSSVGAQPNLQACLLIEPLDASYTAGKQLKYDCGKAFAPGKLGSDGVWTFDLAPLAAVWLAGQNTGAAILPVVGVPQTIPDPSQNYEVSFQKDKSTAQASYSGDVPAAPTTSGPVSTGVFNAPAVASAGAPPPALIGPVPALPPIDSAPPPASAPAARPAGPHAPGRATIPKPGSNNWLLVALAAVLALIGLLAIGTVQQMAKGGESVLNLKHVLAALGASRSQFASPVALVALVAIVALGYTGQVVGAGGLTGGSQADTPQAGAENGATPSATSKATGPAAAGGPAAAAGGAGGAASTSAGGARAGTSGAVAGTGRTVAGDAPGVTATRVKIGFFRSTNDNYFNKASGFNNVNSYGNLEVEARAISNYINAHGGIAGHQVDPDFQTLDSASTDTTQAERLCTAFTEQDHVFAVVNVLVNQTESDSACYAQHHTLLLDDSLYHEDNTFYRQYYPYIWTSSHLNLGRMIQAAVDGFHGQGYFGTGYKLGVIGIQNPSFQRIHSSLFLPRLAQYGLTESAYHELNPSADQATLRSALNSYVLDFESKGINHVMFSGDGGGSIAVSFMLAAKSQHYTPTYGLTDYDAPQAIAATGAVPDQLANAQGAGYAMFLDVNDADGLPYPSGAKESQCAKIMQDGGQGFSSRASAGLSALPACDSMFLLQQATQSLGPNLTIQGFAAGVNALGSSYQASVPYATTIDGRHQDLASAYRMTAYEAGCACFRYRSGAQQAPD